MMCARTKRLRKQINCTFIVAAAASLLPGGGPAMAQESTYARGIAAAEATATSPRDFGGVWVTRTYVPRLSNNPPYRPEAEARFKAYSPASDPGSRCMPAGWPRIISAPYPFEIIQTPMMIIFYHEMGNVFRRVWTDGRQHPEDLDPTWYGHSIGWWEGDTLVIDTVGINDKQFLTPAGDVKSEALHTVERWTLAEDRKTLQFDLTVDDPEVFTAPWTAKRLFHKTTDEVMEYVCAENNRNHPDDPNGLNYRGATPYRIYDALPSARAQEDRQ
jgi:hypothetical protein